MPKSQIRIQREDFYRMVPQVVSALRDIGRVIESAGIEKELLELVKVRASQMNVCTFCTELHLKMAQELGIPQDKLAAIADWRETHLLSARERAALAWTEVLTDLAPTGVPDETYMQAIGQFPGAQLAALSSAIGVINFWNRVAVGFAFEAPELTTGRAV